MHEYSVIGHPREKIIYWLAFISIISAPLVSKFIDMILNNYLSITWKLTISGVAIYTILYILFNKYLWKIEAFSKLFKFPNLNGEWQCVGKSYNPKQNKNFNWNGNIKIVQTWDKISITLKTSNSTSQSMSSIGGIKHIPGIGYKLAYNYENSPHISSTELAKHEGYCSLDISEERISADGYYFNNAKERQTFGEMKLTRSGQ
ncbi:MAG: hypothetical protein P4L49_07725 [Desulfosporosinus sp.]|nr:hypothetical protein [Desulfosporosinus sp.]